MWVTLICRLCRVYDWWEHAWLDPRCSDAMVWRLFVVDRCCYCAVSPAYREHPTSSSSLNDPRTYGSAVLGNGHSFQERDLRRALIVQDSRRAKVEKLLENDYIPSQRKNGCLLWSQISQVLYRVCLWQKRSTQDRRQVRGFVCELGAHVLEFGSSLDQADHRIPLAVRTIHGENSYQIPLMKVVKGIAPAL